MFVRMPDLLDRRLVFVTGKGGVGKSTVATALGLLAARGGRRTIVAELSGQERVQRAFDRDVEPFAEAELAPGLFTISIDPQHAMAEYLHLRVGALGGVLASSRLFGAFAMATPGMRELLSIGKVWELAQFERRSRGGDPYDLVIVDAPATGHGVGILRTPRTFAEIARVGPIARQGAAIASTIADPQFTAIVAVTTAEEMPVNETLAAAQAIGEEGLTLSGVIVNALYPTRFDAAEAARLEGVGAAGEDRDGTAMNAAVRAALSEHARAAGQQLQLARLRESLPEAEIAELPFLFVPEIELPELEGLADRLAGWLGRPAAAAG